MHEKDFVIRVIYEKLIKDINIKNIYSYIKLEQKFVAFLALKFLYFKNFIFYKISMTPFDRAKFQLLKFVLQITVR